MFINTGTLMTLDTPNQITGVMAHETGHMAAWRSGARGGGNESRDDSPTALHGGRIGRDYRRRG